MIEAFNSKARKKLQENKAKEIKGKEVIKMLEINEVKNNRKESRLLNKPRAGSLKRITKYRKKKDKKNLSGLWAQRCK